jgi:hypothetical protein
MFTFSIIYVVFYLLIFLSICFFLFTQIPFYVITHFSIPNVMIFLQKYKYLSFFYFWLLFMLTGLPPFGLFFVKFNIFFFILHNTNIISIVLIFFFFFFNMLFYLQVFNFKNFKKNNYHLVTPEIFLLWKDNHNFTTYSTYSIVKFSVNILFFLFFMFLFFADYYLILFIIIVNNKSMYVF